MNPKFIKYKLEDWSTSPSSEHDFSFEDALSEIKRYPVKEQYLRRKELDHAPEPQVVIKTSDNNFVTVIFKENGTYSLNMYFKVGTYQRFGLSFYELEDILSKYYFSKHKNLFVELSKGDKGFTIVGSTLYCRFLSAVWGLEPIPL